MSFGSGSVPGGGQRNQAAERLQEMALGRGAEQRGRDPFAHHVADDDVEAVVAVLEEIVEVAVDALRGNRERGHADAGHVSGRLVEQQRLLDLEADLDLLFPRARQFLLRALAVGDVFGDPDEILWRSIGAENRHLDGVQVAQATMRGLDRLLGDFHHLAAVSTARSLATKKLACSSGKKS